MRTGVLGTCVVLLLFAAVPSVASAFRLPERDPAGAQLARVEPAVCTADQGALWDFASGSSGAFVGHLTGQVTCPPRGSVIRLICTVSLVDATGAVLASSPQGTGYASGYDYPATCDTGQLDVGPLASDERGYFARFQVSIDVRGEGADVPVSSFCMASGGSAGCTSDLPLQPGVGTAARFE